MLIKPNVKDEEIIICLRDSYGLYVKEISFLPLGADFNTAVYRITTNEEDYFLKLRRQEFNEAVVLVQNYLVSLGLKQIISPIATKTGQLWTNLSPFTVVLYPFVEGNNSMEVKLSEQQWIEFGSMLKKFHSTQFPTTITNNLPRETFSTRWREMVKAYLKQIEDEGYAEPVAVKMALFLKSKSREILQFVERAENLACLLQKQALEHIVCHADVHSWNLLISKEGMLYLVDWDTLILAPKERDLMFVGAGLGDSGRTPFEEEKLFYQGYGQATINQAAIAYYRYERVIEDIGTYCEQIFLSDKGGEERAQSFEYLQSNFLPNGPIERARQLDIS